MERPKKCARNQSFASHEVKGSPRKQARLPRRRANINTAVPRHSTIQRSHETSSLSEQFLTTMHY